MRRSFPCPPGCRWVPGRIRAKGRGGQPGIRRGGVEKVADRDGCRSHFTPQSRAFAWPGAQGSRCHLYWFRVMGHGRHRVRNEPERAAALLSPPSVPRGRGRARATWPVCRAPPSVPRGRARATWPADLLRPPAGAGLCPGAHVPLTRRRSWVAPSRSPTSGSPSATSSASSVGCPWPTRRASHGPSSFAGSTRRMCSLAPGAAGGCGGCAQSRAGRPRGGSWSTSGCPPSPSLRGRDHAIRRSPELTTFRPPEIARLPHPLWTYYPRASVYVERGRPQARGRSHPASGGPPLVCGRPPLVRGRSPQA